MSLPSRRALNKQLASKEMQHSQAAEHQSKTPSTPRSVALFLRRASKKRLASKEMQSPPPTEQPSSRCSLKKCMLADFHHQGHRRSLCTPRKSTPRKHTLCTPRKCTPRKHTLC